jgi:hypothetical protein
VGARLTLAVLAVGLVLTGLGVWHQNRPRELGTLGFPATPALAIGLVLVIVTLAHLVTLWTGFAMPGRRPF